MKKKTPYEIFCGKKPDVSNLRLYGSKVFVRKPEQKRRSKWDKKAEMGILIGYSENGYRVLLNNEIIVARHIEIIEASEDWIGINRDESEIKNNFETKSSEDDEVSNSSFKRRDENLECNKNKKVKQTEIGLEMPRRSERIKSCPDRYDEYKIKKNNMFVNYCKMDTPNTFEEAVKSKESIHWINAMDREIDSLYKNKTWELVNNIKKKNY